jgi:site-specific DNA recombinase
MQNPMKSAAIYARYSSDKQSDSSVEDQVRICKELCEDRGWQIKDIYKDHAISGASLRRAGIQALLDDARNGRFDVVVSEALDRISRDQEDIAGVFKRLTFTDIQIVTLSEGTITDLHVGLKGTMNALFLKDLADKTRRGQRGRAEAGFIPGGLTYGYEAVKELDEKGELVRGKRRINCEQAKIVKQIFEAYAKGDAVRTIAKNLNVEGIPSPRGGQWNVSTITGSRSRQNGILHNEMYIGFIVYNRQRFTKDPYTGKRVSRLNPRNKWIVTDAAHLRIIPDYLWNRVQRLKARYAPQGKKRRETRPKHLLSGLLRCGACNGKYTVIGSNRFGCSTHREKGTCANNRTISIRKLQAIVLQRIQVTLSDTNLEKRLVEQARQSVRARLKAHRVAEREKEARLTDINAKLSRLITLVESGTTLETVQDRISALEERKKEINFQYRDVSDPNNCNFNSKNERDLRISFSRLKTEIAETDLSSSEIGQTLVRSILGSVTLSPHKNREGLKIDAEISLLRLLDFQEPQGA